MVITVEQLKELAAAFRNPDPQYAAVAEAMRREQSKSPAERRADTERLLIAAAQVEAAGGPHAVNAGKFRAILAAELFCGKIADGTPFAP